MYCRTSTGTGLPWLSISETTSLNSSTPFNRFAIRRNSSAFCGRTLNPFRARTRDPSLLSGNRSFR